MLDLLFNNPKEMLTEHEAKKAKTAAAVVTLGPLLGSWEACNKETRGLVRVVVSEHNGQLMVHAYGACSPTPCDWLQVQGLAYADSVNGGPAVAFTAKYSFAFKDTILTGVIDRGCLIVEDYNTFKDGSGRANYFDKGYFCKAHR
jgi:hypothetical protein